MPKSRKRLSTNQLSLVLLAGGMTAGFLIGALFGDAETLPPAQAIGIVAFFGISVIASQIWYMRRTDEHDLHAHLWSMAWAWLSIGVVTPSWWLLNKAGIAPQPDAIQVLIASMVIGTVAWLWMRFR